ncbi:hypothetical protein LNO12_08455 [Klebsiella pneumoniae subsp. pneumoniae]|nr:hypothetical protein [Klebsiella pneumoniae subsp. pneumoniae]
MTKYDQYHRRRRLMGCLQHTGASSSTFATVSTVDNQKQLEALARQLNSPFKHLTKQRQGAIDSVRAMSIIIFMPFWY